LSKIKRKTINRILQLSRAKIAEFTAENSCFNGGEIDGDTQSFDISRLMLYFSLESCGITFSRQSCGTPQGR
jgi:hypothetical protein